jgi:hypothetical protein
MRRLAQKGWWIAGVVLLVAFLAVRSWPVREAASVEVASPKISRSGATARSGVAVPRASFPVIELRTRLARWHQLTTGDADAQERLTAELTALLTDDNVAGIVHMLTADELDTPFGRAALARWLAVDPTAAAWIAARPRATEAQALLVARVLGKEPARLQEFCDALPDSEWKQNFLSAAALECGAQNPVLAIEVAQRLAPGAAQTNALQTVAYDWATRDPRAASAWMLQIEDAALRESLLAVGTKALAFTDPDLATSWLDALKPDGARSETALCVVETWVARDPVAAANWVARITTPELRAAAVELIARRWLRSDAATATVWLEKQPERDAVLAKLAAEAVGVPDPADF